MFWSSEHVGQFFQDSERFEAAVMPRMSRYQYVRPTSECDQRDNESIVM